MRCPHCQAPNADEARFCGVCGKATSATEPVSDPSLGAAPALLGKEIAGRYRMLAKLGEGGMGAVYRAEQISLKRSVAVKLLRPDVAASPTLLSRFNAEAEAVAKLSHPNTVNIYDFGQDSDGTLFIAMEFIEGKSLRTVVHEEAPLPLRRALGIAQQVAASLADAHARSIIHRDLKPDNVMLQTRGRQRDIVRVLDFGIAKLRDDKRTQQMTQAGDMLGTPQYMAPEQIRAEMIDGRTDVYALGCMLYEMVTARLPFDAPTVMALLSKHLLEQPVPPSQRRPDLALPPAIDHLITSAMAKDPGQRAPTMEAYGEQIAAVLATLPADTERASAPIGVPSGPAMMPSPHAGYVAPPTPHAGARGYTAPAPYPAQTPPLQPYAPQTPHGQAYTAPAQPVAPAPVYAQPPPAMYAPGTPPPAPSPYAAAAAPAAPAKSHTALIGIALLLAAGAAVAIVVAMKSRKHEEPVTDPWRGSAEPVKQELPQLPEVPQHQLSPSDDPWGRGGASATPAIPPSSGTLPSGANLVAPPGFERVDQPNTRAIVDKAHGIVVVMAPITSASTDPEQLATEWASLTHVTFDGMTNVSTHGQVFPAARFTGTGADGPFLELGGIYQTSSYRLAVIVIAAASTAGQSQFQPWLLQFFENNIELP